MSTTEQQHKALEERIPECVGIDRWDEVVGIICDNAFSDWKYLAQTLNIEKSEIADLAKSKVQDQDKCLKVLSKWYEQIPRKLWPLTLKDALKKCRLHRLADILEKVVSSVEPIEQILMLHENREERMRQAMYCVAEQVASDWRRVAGKLGLTKRDIADIEARFDKRPREKCMHALYKWRLMVPLQGFKVTSLIQAVMESHMPHAAVAVLPFAEKNFQLPKLRKKRSGEAIIHIEVKRIDVLCPETQTTTAYLFGKDILREYVLNKIFLRLLDALDTQYTFGAHPLVTYLHSVNASDISLVSRANFALIVDCGCRDNLLNLYELSCSGELDERLTECLVGEEILVELTVEKIYLQAQILNRELITPAPSTASTARAEGKSFS